MEKREACFCLYLLFDISLGRGNRGEEGDLLGNRRTRIGCEGKRVLNLLLWCDEGKLSEGKGRLA